MNLISFLIFLLLGSGTLLFSFFSLKKIIFEGKLVFAILFLVYFLAVNATLQIVVFDVTRSIELAIAISYLKELYLFLALVSWALYNKGLSDRVFLLSRYDYVGLFFLVLVTLFYILPIGPASFANKTIYYKNIVVLASMYFLGRNMSFSQKDVLALCHLLLLLVLLAFPLVLIEKLSNTHFQSMIGYTDYIIAKGGEPTGSYGLQYTFQANSGAKRFAAFFASPLELATVSILAFTTSFILANVFHQRRWIYVPIAVLSFICLLFSFSRAPIAGFFLMLVFIGYLFGYWRYILAAGLITLIFLAIPFFFGNEDLRFFIIDTFTLADPSSVGHVVDWLDGIESMLESPEGIGMGTSGNAGGVDPELQIGGENQFIILGVQFGVVALLIYGWMVIKSITISKKVFIARRGQFSSIIPFITATFKVAFFMSLMTANGEIYNLVAYLAWWMIGYTIQLNHSLEAKETRETYSLSQLAKG